MTMTPSLMSSRKMSLIIVQNVAELLVRPKNMTRGSNRPRFVRKAAFHSSPSLILTLLYPHQTSSLVKYFALALDTMLRMSGIRGRGVGILYGQHIELPVV